MLLHGSIVALVTPMQHDGAIDYSALERLVEFHIQEGTHGIVAVGTTGESATLTVSEHLKVIEKVVQTAHGRVPIIAGTGANSTNEAIELSRRAKSVGADAGLSVVPYYNKPNQTGLLAHFTAIADTVDLPLVMYNVPGRTVADLHNESVLKLMEHANIIGLKDATGNLQRGRELLDASQGRLTVLSGDDGTALDLMKLGAKGDISVTANVAPKLMSQMCGAALEGQFEDAEGFDAQLRDLHRMLFVDSNPIPVEYLVSKMGYTRNVLRLPLTTVSTQLAKQLDDVLDALVDKPV